MPQYTYRCRECGNEYDQVLPMDSRTKPLEFPCSECKQFAMYQKLHPTKLSYQGNMKTTSNFNDRLKEIKNNLPPDAQQNISDHIK